MKLRSLLVALALAVQACEREPAPPRAPSARAETAVVLRPAGREPFRVRVEIAATDASRTLGLMHRRTLDADAGMLFLFDRDDVQQFWMKNTLIPLDMVFIDRDKRVVGVVENAEPETLTPRSVGVPSRYVLEVNAGVCRAHGVDAGTPAEFVGVAR